MGGINLVERWRINDKIHACTSLQHDICNVTCSAVKQYEKTTNIPTFCLKLLLHKWWAKNFSKISSQTEMHKTHHNVNLCYNMYNVRSSKWANCPDYMQLLQQKTALEI